MSEGATESGNYFFATSPDMAVVGGAHFSVNRNEYDRTQIAQSCIKPPTVVLAQGSRKNPPPKVACIPWRPLHAVHHSSVHRLEGAGVRGPWHLIYAAGPRALIGDAKMCVLT